MEVSFNRNSLKFMVFVVSSCYKDGKKKKGEKNQGDEQMISLSKPCQENAVSTSLRENPFYSRPDIILMKLYKKAH